MQDAEEGLNGHSSPKAPLKKRSFRFAASNAVNVGQESQARNLSYINCAQCFTGFSTSHRGALRKELTLD